MEDKRWKMEDGWEKLDSGRSKNKAGMWIVEVGIPSPEA
jgi:hypothetical protein